MAIWANHSCSCSREPGSRWRTWPESLDRGQTAGPEVPGLQLHKASACFTALTPARPQPRRCIQAARARQTQEAQGARSEPCRGTPAHAASRSAAISSDFSQGGNPVASGPEETLPSVGGRGCVAFCPVITKLGAAWQCYTAADPGAAARTDLAVVARSVKREPGHAPSGQRLESWSFMAGRMSRAGSCCGRLRARRLRWRSVRLPRPWPRRPAQPWVPITARVLHTDARLAADPACVAQEVWGCLIRSSRLRQDCLRTGVRPHRRCP